MLLQGVCKYCNTEFTKQRNPYQQYCSGNLCQRERKNAWRRSKVVGDGDYSTNQKSANQRWQSNNPDYWRNYRLSHPDYVQRNRKAQRARDSTRSMNASHLAKSDAFPNETLIGSGSYWLMPVGGDLAKSDALEVEITVITKGCHAVPDLAKIPLYIHSG